MPVSAADVSNSFAKALDHVRATATPNDGGLTEAAVEALRDMSNDPGFQQTFNSLLNQRMDQRTAPAAPANTPAAPAQAPTPTLSPAQRNTQAQAAPQNIPSSPQAGGNS